MLLPGSTDNSRTVAETSWQDMIISLKMLVLQCAKLFGQDQITQKFDLKMLRALGLIMMEYVKEKVKEKSLVAGLGESVAFLDSCNLLKCDVENILDSEEVLNCIAAKLRKRHANRVCFCLQLALQLHFDLCFRLLLVVKKHDIKDKKTVGTMPQALILINFTTKLSKSTSQQRQVHNGMDDELEGGARFMVYFLCILLCFCFLLLKQKMCKTIEFYYVCFQTQVRTKNF
ncbi:uncharacterized protein LOC133830759 isoform X2 [Humulus lupulus]|uniref:uncharacterized protein LOC133830759 isoform X2 n=1 Tax=Humulus lupulus TaxID=3486 RepID=UPI002B400FE6|nr:uncharacterized protein LOC133830759 isoform X2 [Humulus lupulus]